MTWGRWALSTLLGACVASAGLALAAPAAHADTVSVGVPCSDGPGSPAVQVDVRRGDTLSFSTNQAHGCNTAQTVSPYASLTYFDSWPGPNAAGDIDVGGLSAIDYVVAADAPLGLTPTVAIVVYNFDRDAGRFYELNILPARAPAVATAPLSPPPWVQAFGRSNSDAGCQVGWGPSWQMWAVHVTGGWVCTRTIASLG